MQHSPGFTYKAFDAADEVSAYLAESLHTKLRDICSAADMYLTAETAGTCFFPAPRHQVFKNSKLTSRFSVCSSRTVVASDFAH